MAIKIKKSREGLLHDELGVPEGHDIPAKKLAKAKHSTDPAIRKRATFAENAKHWHHADGGREERAHGGTVPAPDYKNAGDTYVDSDTKKSLGDPRKVTAKVKATNVGADERFEQPEFDEGDRIPRKHGGRVGHKHDGVALRGHTRARFK